MKGIRLKNKNLIDYQGVFIIPTLHKIEVPDTNIIENLIKSDRLIDTTFFADTVSIPRPKKITLDTKILKSPWEKEKSVFK